MSRMHGFICECTDPKCRERVRLTEEQYDRVSRLGTVVSSKCRDAHQPADRIVLRAVGFVVLTSSTARVAA